MEVFIIFQPSPKADVLGLKHEKYMSSRIHLILCVISTL